MRILGIDPGTARLGYGIIVYSDNPTMVDFGVIETPKAASMPERLSEIYDQVGQLIERHRPEAIAIEQLFFARNVTTAISVGQARGVVLLAAARSGISVEEYSPSEVKHAIVGYGKADKKQVQEMVRIILGLDHIPQPDDAADALAIALCHGQTAPFAERTRVPYE